MTRLGEKLGEKLKKDFGDRQPLETAKFCPRPSLGSILSLL